MRLFARSGFDADSMGWWNNGMHSSGTGLREKGHHVATGCRTRGRRKSIWTLIAAFTFGLALPATSVAALALGDFVWHDLNADGIQDAGEPGIAGAEVRLIQSDDLVVVATTTTTSTGIYNFGELPEGEYRAQFLLPAGFDSYSPAGVGTDKGLDSDAYEPSGYTNVFSLDASDFSIDAGFFMFAAVGDFVWEDLNRNGIQDAGEPGIPGISVTLYNSSDNVLALSTTDANGLFQFVGLRPDSYYLEFLLPSDFDFTVANVGADDSRDSDVDPATRRTHVFTLMSGETNNTIDAGLICRSCVVVSVPEPGTLSVLLLGLAVLVFSRPRRKGYSNAAKLC